MVLGAQLYTVREFTQTEKDVESTFKRIADIGYKFIQVSGMGNIPAEMVREIADKNGLKIVITHTNQERVMKDTLAVIKEHQIMGCKHIGLGSMGFTPSGAESYYKFIKDYDEAASLIHKNGMRLHYHNHSFEFQKYGDKTGFDILVNETDPELWGFILDTYWVQVGGKNPVDVIFALKGRIDAIHFKDLTIVDNKQRMTEVMEGNFNWCKIIEACENTGISYALVEQDSDWTVGPFESLETSYRNLSQFFK
jgi:sugar phosphate isomerase/epimerase